MRKLGIFIVTLIVIVIAGLLIAPAFINIDRYRGRMEAELQKRLDRPVTIGMMHLRLLPLKFSADNAVIGEDPQFGSGAFVTVRKLSVSVKIWPLLRRKVELKGVNLVRPEIELIRNAQGVWNFSSIGAAVPAPSSQPSAPTPPPAAQQPGVPQAKPQAAPAPAFELASLRIRDGKIALTDDQRRQPRSVYDHIDVALKNFTRDQAFQFALAAHLPGKGAEIISLAGTAGPINRANSIATPLQGTLKLDEVLISGLENFLRTAPVAQIEGSISGDASVSNQGGTLASAGILRLQNAVIHNVTLGFPVSVDYQVSDNPESGVVRITGATIHLGATPLAISGNLNTRSTPAQVDLKLNTQGVSLANAARLASAFGVAFNPNTKIDGRLSANIHARGAMPLPAVNGAASIRDLAISGSDVPTPVSVPAINVFLSPQEIRSNNFNAKAANTNLDVRFAITQYVSHHPLVNAALRTNNAQISDLLSMARAWFPRAVQGMTASGLLTFDLTATGPPKNPSAMNVSGSGQVQNAILKTASLHQPLTVHNANLQFTGSSVVLQNLAASLAGTNASGGATVRNFSAPDVQFKLDADQVNVAELQQAIGSASAPAQRRAGIPGTGVLGWKAALQMALVPRVYAAPAPANAGQSPTSGVLEKISGGGTVHIGTVQYDQLLLTNANANITLDHGLVHMAPVTTQLYGGQEAGTITVDTRSTPMLVQVNSKLQGVQANDLISSLTALKNTIYGVLAANTQTSFRATNAADVTRTLNGTLDLNLSNGRITKLDLLNELASVGKFAGVRKSSQAVTDFVKLTGHFNINNGVASTNDLRADIANGSLAGDGIVNLATQDLNMHLTAVLSKGLSQSVGGTGVGGFMQTALANKQGELVIPVVITGTFDHPQVAPDVQKVAQMKLQNLLPTSGNPGALTSGLVGSILKGGGAGAQTQQKGGITGLLGGIAGGQQAGQKQGQQPVASPQQPQAQQPPQQPSNMLKEALGDIMGHKKEQQQQQQNQPQK